MHSVVDPRSPLHEYQPEHCHYKQEFGVRDSPLSGCKGGSTATYGTYHLWCSYTLGCCKFLLEEEVYLITMEVNKTTSLVNTKLYFLVGKIRMRWMKDSLSDTDVKLLI